MFAKKLLAHLSRGFKVMVLMVSVSILSFSLSYFALAAAWTGPGNNPPNPNLEPPLNVGPVGQSKIGGLILNTGGAPLGLVVQKGKVGIGTAAPVDKLQISSALSGSDDSSIMIENSNPTDAKTRLRFVTDAGEFLISRTSTTYSPWQASAGDAVFNIEGNPNNYRFLTNNAASVSADRMIITSEGDVSIPTQSKGLVLKATDDDTKCFRLTVNSAGSLSTSAVACP